MIKPIEFVEKDYCINCNSEHAIQCFTTYNKIINYSSLLKRLGNNESLDNILGRAELAYMKCNKCKKEYKIQWNVEKNIPEPMFDDIFFNYFMSFYKK